MLICASVASGCEMDRTIPQRSRLESLRLTWITLRGVSSSVPHIIFSSKLSIMYCSVKSVTPSHVEVYEKKRGVVVSLEKNRKAHHQYRCMSCFDRHTQLDVLQTYSHPPSLDTTKSSKLP